MKFTLDELAWLKLTAFYWKDAESYMHAMGVSASDAHDITCTEAFRRCDIVSWWIDYGSSHLGPIFLQYLEKQLKGYYS